MDRKRSILRRLSWRTSTKVHDKMSHHPSLDTSVHFCPCGACITTGGYYEKSEETEDWYYQHARCCGIEPEDACGGTYVEGDKHLCVRQKGHPGACGYAAGCGHTDCEDSPELAKACRKRAWEKESQRARHA